MRKRVIFLCLTVMLGLSGCQPAPEAAGDPDVFRAKGSEDEQVQAIMEQGTDAGSRYKAGDMIQLVLGEGDNRIRIDARFPAVTMAPGTLVMRADTDMDEEVLRAFLEPQDEVRDMTQEYLKEWERRNEQAVASSIAAGEGQMGLQKMGSIGDPDFCIVLTDGNRTVNGEDQFFVSYEDAALMERCWTVLEQESDETGESAGFSLQEALDVLMRKLSFLGIGEIDLRETRRYEADGFCFYEMVFMPSFGGVAVMEERGGQTAGEIRPRGWAWVCADGCAQIDLRQFCMRVADTETGESCDFDRALELLALYLKNEKLLCGADALFTEIAYGYYPLFKQGKLRLVPAWNFYLPLDQYIDHVREHGDVRCWGLYLDALTGNVLGVNE